MAFLLIGVALGALQLRAGAVTRNRLAATQHQRCVLMSSGLVNEDSSLAELRNFVREHGLNVKTAGPGRTKATILVDILQAVGAGGAEAAAEVALETEAQAGAAADAVAAQPDSRETGSPARAAPLEVGEATGDPIPGAPPPDGFTWGATF